MEWVEGQTVLEVLDEVLVGRCREEDVEVEGETQMEVEVEMGKENGIGRSLRKKDAGTSEPKSRSWR